eukprot:756589-Hanusia_phi.AAC.4
MLHQEKPDKNKKEKKEKKERRKREKKEKKERKKEKKRIKEFKSANETDRNKAAFEAKIQSLAVNSETSKKTSQAENSRSSESRAFDPQIYSLLPEKIEEENVQKDEDEKEAKQDIAAKATNANGNDQTKDSSQKSLAETPSIPPKSRPELQQVSGGLNASNSENLTKRKEEGEEGGGADVNKGDWACMSYKCNGHINYRKVTNAGECDDVSFSHHMKDAKCSRCGAIRSFLTLSLSCLPSRLPALPLMFPSPFSSPPQIYPVSLFDIHLTVSSASSADSDVDLPSLLPNAN